MTSTGKKVLVSVAIFVAVVCFITGLMIGWFLLDDPMTPEADGTSNRTRTVTSSQRTASSITSPSEPEDLMISEKLLQEIQASNIRDHLRVMSGSPALAGTEFDQRLVDYITEHFEALGYDVTLYPYDVMLSYPAEEHFNRVSMLDGRGNALHTTERGAVTRPDFNNDVTWPFCMYSPSGRVKGKLIYANYGRPRDFKFLEKKGVVIDKAIVLMRYGKISRGKKVREAHKRGGAAVILYDDPADVSINVTSNFTHHDIPATWWWPDDDLEHGNMRTSNGDPATPGYAATEGAYRIPKKQMELPSLPCHPVGYSDARMLMQNVEGEPAPRDWEGQLGIPYTVATDSKGTLPVELSVKNVLETRRLYNVMATMKGETEPDRVVLVGNHRDAVTYGPLDPRTGTAIMLETARAFASVSQQEGWKPRRSITFCSWAAQQFGLIGSTEWVEERANWLSGHTVAYLNLDAVIQGNYTFDMSATPSLKAAAIRAASKVPDPFDNSSSVLDTWSARLQDDRDYQAPWIRHPMSTTDLQPFVQMLGVPVSNSRYSFVEENGKLLYPVRNNPISIYDTYRKATRMDPTFSTSKAVGSILAEMTRDLADSAIIPLHPVDYAMDIIAHLTPHMEKAAEKFNASVYHLQSAMDAFLQASSKIQSEIENQDLSALDLLGLRRLNDRLMLFEREFVNRQERSHLFLTARGSSKPNLDRATMTLLSQALRAAANTLAS